LSSTRHGPRRRPLSRRAATPARARAGEAAGTGTVYRWVDAEGVTHYDQSGGAGREAVALDPSRIQRLEDLAPPVKN